MSMVRPRRRLPLLVAGVLLLLATGAWWVAVPAAHAADQTVAVQSSEEGGRYAPGEVTIALGDTVTWVWETDGHSVTHQPAEGEEPLFDSHPNDPDEPLGGCPPFCGEQGDTFAFSDFPEPGRYEYFSKANPGMRGVVVVTERVEEETSSPSPTPARPAPTSEPEPSPTATSEPEPSPQPPPPDPEPEPEPEPPPPDPAPRTAQPAPVERESSPSPSPTAGEPTVAGEATSPSPIPEPTFEEFPDAQAPTPDGEVEGEVAIGGTDGGPSRTVWALVGGASVLGTLGAFGRTLLLSDAWNG